MRNNRIAMIVVGLFGLGLTGSLFAASVQGSKHDMTQAPYTLAGGVCDFCHTPHNGNPAYPALWNHSTTAVAAFAVYTGAGSLNSVPGQPTGVSKMCLSCHDGTVALENYGGVTTGTRIIGVGAGTSAASNLGTNLSNDHPVSMTYDAALVTADGALRPITTLVPALGATATIASKMLFAGKVECASCHNVHDNQFTNFLRFANTNSSLCITCHIK